MYRTNRTFKDYTMFLYSFILFAIQIITVLSATVSFISHKNASTYDFDITTIYRITDISVVDSSKYDGFKDPDFLRMNKDYYSIEIHSRTNAKGMPIQSNNEYLLENHEDDFFNNRFYQNSSHMNISYTHHLENWRSINIPKNGDKYNKEYTVAALEYMYQNLMDGNNLYAPNLKYQTVFVLHWNPKKEHTGLTFTYVHTLGSFLDVIVEIENENDKLITSAILEKYEDIMTLNVKDTVFMKGQVYKLSLKMKRSTNAKDDYVGRRRHRYSYEYKGLWFGLIRIAQYSNYEEEEIRLISFDENGNRTKAFHVIVNATEHFEENLSKKLCLNGGIMYSKKSACTCPTGFTGTYCETGCGKNSYGADCTGVCSDFDKMCRGMYMCTSYGCTCPAGLTGPLCNEDCGTGKYGADCQQTCSANCHNNICNQYTGICSQGCLPGYIPPYCLEKYPYLINPPRLIANTYQSIEIEINFDSDNVNSRDKNINLKYYQLFYKSLGEKTFRNSDIKFINLYYNRTTEILLDLESGNEYMVGVLVITDEGNFNDQDIVYGHYKTSCTQPQIYDYNLKLISGQNSINVTWKKFIPNPPECKITYVVTLMTTHSTNQKSSAKEIISSSDSGHIIEGLLPGFHYNIRLNPKTPEGPLHPSPIYTITTLLTEKDMEIKDIFAESTNEKIKVSWILVNSYRHQITYNESNVAISYIVRYKINKILSCSLQKIEQNWTSVILYNHTEYVITDTVPNSQYNIQVIIDDNNATYAQPENNVYALTPATNPKTAPVIDIEQPIYVTNNSVSFHWKTDDNDCSKLNGFFSNFYIELRDKKDNILKIKETKQNNITFNDLKSNTPYELKVFIKTHFGYDSEQFLYTNFSTKLENLKPVDDLVAYKKSLKDRVVGLRWSYLENTNLDGFIISFNQVSFANTENVSVISPTKCAAWPQYYCHSFHDLIPRNYYTFKIKPKSLEYPEGGKESLIYFSSVDGLPDSPKNVQATDIGNTYISLKWEIPWIFNGLLKSFNINVEEVSATDMNTCCITIAPIEILIDEEVPSYNYTLTDLKPGSTYSIGVLTVSKSSWYSSPARISATTLPDV